MIIVTINTNTNTNTYIHSRTPCLLRMSSYISSPTASTASLPPLNFDSSMDSISKTTTATNNNNNNINPNNLNSSTSNHNNNKRNFWDFDSYSRVFLHERKAIEKEKLEWEVQVKVRNEILTNSANFYYKKSSELSERVEKCLEEESKLEEDFMEVEVLERELIEANLRVNQLKLLHKYFGRLEVLIENGIEDEKSFEENLLAENWKGSLDLLVNLITTSSSNSSSSSNNSSNSSGLIEHENYLHQLDDANTFKSTSGLLNLERKAQEIICKRLNSFYAAISTKISKFIEDLGWPSIKTFSEESVEIITKLQELLTYGEALYLLSQRCATVTISHPISAFIEPIKIRFNYHFSGDRPTNRIDRPDWYFANLLSFIRENCSFMREFVLPCWRLRNIDDSFTEGPVQLADTKTLTRISDIKMAAAKDKDNNTTTTQEQELVIIHLIEFGKFYKTLNEEFGYALGDGFERKFNEIFCGDQVEMEEFIKSELERIKSAYKEEFDGNHRTKDSNSNDSKDAADPSTAVLKFLTLFNEATVVPYSHIPNITLKSHLLHRVQSWLLESFYNKLMFECSPLHSSESDILHDMNMVKALETICKVLRDEFGESMECIELSAAPELHEIIGYDPSNLPGTCFNRAITEFQAISNKLNNYIFNWVMGRFLKNAILHSNSMNYCKVSDSNCEDVDLPMNENFRLAVINLERALSFVSPHLASTNVSFKSQLIEKLAEFMYKSVLLGNFFTDSGVRRFAQDVEYLKGSLSNQPCFKSDSSSIRVINEAFAKVNEAVELLKINEKDPTAPFDSTRLLKAIKDNRKEELKRFLEMTRLTHISIDDLSQIFASRKY